MTKRREVLGSGFRFLVSYFLYDEHFSEAAMAEEAIFVISSMIEDLYNCMDARRGVWKVFPGFLWVN